MKLGDLIEQLESLQEMCGDNAEVLFMGQPNYPFEYSIAGVLSRGDMDSDDEEVHSVNGTDPSDIFLVEGSQLRYGSKKAWCSD
jgi:hypothetical protein